MPRICKENDLGPIEYKRELKDMIDSKIKKYATQMKFRLIEGNGLAYYLIGVKLYCKLMAKICREVKSKIIKVELIGDITKYMKFTIKSQFELESIYKF